MSFCKLLSKEVDQEQNRLLPPERFTKKYMTLGLHSSCHALGHTLWDSYL